MINIIKQEIPIDESLKKKLEFICDFCNTTPTFINGSIRKIDKSNLVYVEPHRVIINNIMFLVFNYSNDVYIKNFGNKIKINELEDYLIEKIEINIVNFQEIYTSMVLLKMIQLNNTYKFSKEHDLGKEKDDYEIEM